MHDIKDVSFIEDLGHLCESIGYRMGSESYVFVSPIIQSLGTFKSKFIEGFKKGWKEAQMGQLKVINKTVVDGGYITR
jgi:hypothetical protein